MDLPFKATLPLFGVGGLTLILSFIFCCYLWRLRKEVEKELGYKELKYRKLQRLPTDVCPVCLEEFHFGDTLAVCPCKHTFHCKCLVQWLHQSNTCPLCKRRVGTHFGESSRLFHGAVEDV